MDDDDDDDDDGFFCRLPVVTVQVRNRPAKLKTTPPLAAFPPWPHCHLAAKYHSMAWSLRRVVFLMVAKHATGVAQTTTRHPTEQRRTKGTRRQLHRYVHSGAEELARESEKDEVSVPVSVPSLKTS